jgi:hypothetical protein
MRADYAPCRRAGHCCPGVIMSAKFDGEGEEPMCLECADAEPCVFQRLAGRGRDASSTRAEVNIFGELNAAAAQGQVIHRTPEELGIARESKDEPRVPSWIKPPTDTGPGSVGRNVVDRAARKVQQAQLKEIGGELVLMPAGAVMGAEPLEGFIAERRKEGKAMPKNNGRIPEEIRLKILAELPGVSNGEVGRKYDVAEGTVWYIRNKAGIRSTAKPGTREGAGERHAVAVIPKAKPAARSVAIEPQRPGTAAALIGALDRLDAREEYISLQFAVPEVIAMLSGMSDEKRRAFMSAGIRAALLA